MISRCRGGMETGRSYLLMETVASYFTFLHPNSILILILIFGPLFLILVLNKSRASFKSLNLPPGSFGWPIVGETLDFLRAWTDGCPERFIKERVEKYQSRVFRSSLMGKPIAVLTGTEGNKFLYSNENKLVAMWWPPSVQRLLGPCLSNKVGEEARLMRKLLSYYVGPDALMRFYIHTMDLVTQDHINNHWKGQEVVKVFPTIKLYTFELACRLFMSLEDPQQIQNLSSLFNIFLKGIISIDINFPGTRFYSAMRATRSIREELAKMVRQRREALVARNSDSPSSSSDLLSHMLTCPDESGKFMPEAEIVNNILMLLFAGHDTSSVAITMVMKNLAEIPDVYDKVFQEQIEIALSKGESQHLEWEDIQKMRYTWNVVSEVIRLWPPVLGSFREALVDFDYQGYHIPKGWKLYWSAAFTHTDESLFPNCRSFDESRFDGNGPTPYSYVAFGGGPRMCLGKEFARLEILVFLHNAVKRFRWKLQIPNEKISYDPMPTPLQGLPIRLRPH